MEQYAGNDFILCYVFTQLLQGVVGKKKSFIEKLPSLWQGKIVSNARSTKIEPSPPNASNTSLLAMYSHRCYSVVQPTFCQPHGSIQPFGCKEGISMPPPPPLPL